ncbi:NAD(P)/FAD-dependent oxidoreductase [Ensifer sp. B1-9]|uniref:NAD(P)/FAD-dependent oxidoreductase n=1 Tax=Ensifer sp. B1-9 TaxID=3141455 RepID=UPI003D1F6293
MADITVIGGGIIGVCSAIALQAEGYSVEIIDRGLPEEGATYGNCGILAAGEVVPLARPGILTKIPKWLLDPHGPLFVRPRDFLGQIPWLMEFLWAGRRSRVLEIANALAPLLQHAEDDYRELLEKTNIAGSLISTETIMAFNSRADYEKDKFTWDLRARHGLKHRFLGLSDLRSIEPALQGRITCGALLEGWLRFSEPGLVWQRLTQFFVSYGGRIRIGNADCIEVDGGRATGVRLADGQFVKVKQLVVCAGAWSGRLVKSLGIRIPVAALQGYHNHLPHPGIKLNNAVLYANGGFVVTPMQSGIRVGGTIEIAHPDSKPNLSRADIITRKALDILPGLQIAGGKQWMGPHPSMPDSMPVIGCAPHHQNVVLAFGHGQIGMTLGATTAKIVADLVTGRRPSLELGPFNASRFGDHSPESLRAAQVAALAPL